MSKLALVCCLLVILAVPAILGFYVGTSHAVNTCSAPCVVNFNKGMAEDMFWIDYRGDGTVRVYCSETDNRFHEVACP